MFLAFAFPFRICAHCKKKINMEGWFCALSLVVPPFPNNKIWIFINFFTFNQSKILIVRVDQTIIRLKFNHEFIYWNTATAMERLTLLSFATSLAHILYACTWPFWHTHPHILALSRNDSIIPPLPLEGWVHTLHTISFKFHFFVK